MNEADDLLLVTRPRDGLAVLTLNRPEARNALSMPLRKALVSTLAQFDRDGDVRVVILTGAGNVFCAGLDLAELSHNASILASDETSHPIAALQAFSGVVIGAINGAAVTGGFELALACDLVLAADSARFADTHLRVGALPGWHLSQRLSRTVGPYRARHMSFTGDYINASKAAEWGLVSEVVASEQLVARALEIADSILAMPSERLRSYISLIDDGYAGTFADGLVLEAERANVHNCRIHPDEVANRRTAVEMHGKLGGPSENAASRAIRLKG